MPWQHRKLPGTWLGGVVWTPVLSPTTPAARPGGPGGLHACCIKVAALCTCIPHAVWQQQQLAAAATATMLLPGGPQYHCTHPCVQSLGGCWLWGFCFACFRWWLGVCTKGDFCGKQALKGCQLVGCDLPGCSERGCIPTAPCVRLGGLSHVLWSLIWLHYCAHTWCGFAE